MRGFLILCAVAVATANKLGYNYEPIGQNVAVDNGYNGGFGGSSDNGAGRAEGGIAGGTGGGFGGFVNGNDARSFTGGHSGVDFDATPITASEYNKEFYTYSAPEEDFNDNYASERIANSLKRNLRVVFIRAPENQGIANAALQLAKHSTEDRTAIYVLNKQADIGDLVHKLQTVRSSNAHKPEVHFVKYRTPEDAAHAQHTIQAQYDALGGQSRNSNEGIAPVLNFASPVSSSSPSFGSNPPAGLGSTSSIIPSGLYLTPKTSYLPPLLKHK